MKKKRLSRHAVAIAVILALSIALGFALHGVVTLIERHTHPREYRETVEYYAEQYSIPDDVIYAIIKCESSFRPDAVSHAGAVGLMQLVPSTYEWLCTLTGDAYDEAALRDPETSIRYGTYLLSILYREYGNWDTVYAAYNAGMGNANKWLASEEYTDENGVLIATKIPFAETRNYVKKVSAARAVYERLYD